MKKSLLISVLALLTMVLNAQEYKVEKLWGTEDVPNPQHSYGYDFRQGVGLGGKIYISSRILGQIYIYGENGFEGTLEGSFNNHGINTDQAGHLIVSLAPFPQGWICDNVTPMIRVIDPATGATKDLPLSAKAPVNGRLDYLGRAYGNLMDEGELYVPYISGEYSYQNDTGINRYFFKGGKLINEDCYIASTYYYAYGDNLYPYYSTTGTTIVSAVVDAEGNDAILHRTRSVLPRLFYFNGYDLQEDKSFFNTVSYLGYVDYTNGADFFAFNGKNFLICPYKSSVYYLDGFAIIEIGASYPLFIKEPTDDTDYNSLQSNWLNAEVTEDGVLIYQYVPDKSMEVYKMTLANETLKGDLNGDGQVDVTDVDMMIDMVLGRAAADLSLADMNGDGQVDVTDVGMIIDIILGK